MKKTLKSASFITRYFSIFLIAGLVALAGYFLSAKPTSINLITNGSTTQKSTRTFARPSTDTSTVTTANNSGQARSANENARKDVEPETPSRPVSSPVNVFENASTTIGSGYDGIDGSGNTVTKDISTVINKDGGTTITTLRSTTIPDTGNSFQTANVVRTDENNRVVTKTATATTKLNKGDGTLQVTTTNIVTGPDGKAIGDPTTVTEIVRPQARSATDRPDVTKDSKTTTGYSDTKKLAGTTGTTGTITVPVTEPSNVKDEKDCEAKGWRYVDVPANGVDMCVDPDSKECGDRGQSINGVCYYPGDKIPHSDRVVCDWISPANDTVYRWAFNSNNCPEKNTPNPNYVPKTKGDCVGNAGWWDGSKCNTPSSTAKLPGSNMIVCKGVPGKDGQAPIHSYAYVSTIADCPWAQDEIAANCKGDVNPITYICSPRNTREEELLCKAIDKVYNPTTDKCDTPAQTTQPPTEDEKICTSQGKRYSPDTKGCITEAEASGKFKDDAPTGNTRQNPGEKSIDGENTVTPEPGEEIVKEKVNCVSWLPRIWVFNACDKDSAGKSMIPSGPYGEEDGQIVRPEFDKDGPTGNPRQNPLDGANVVTPEPGEDEVKDKVKCVWWLPKNWGINQCDKDSAGQSMTPAGEENVPTLRPDLNKNDNLDGGLTQSEPLTVQINEYLKGLFLDFMGDAPSDVETTEPATNNLQGR